MYYPTKTNPIHLVHYDDGIVRTFKSIESLVNNWHHIRRLDIGAQFKIDYGWLEWFKATRSNVTPARYHEYVLRDSFGDTLDPEDIRQRYIDLKPYRGWRGYPNPRHYGSKRSTGHWHRRIRTTHERKWVHAWDEEEFVPQYRAARQGHNLPDAWDDIPRSFTRNWKNYRRTQWS